MKRHHHLPAGTEIEAGGVRFRVWAPDAKQAAVALEGGPVLPMRAEAEGWFSLTTDQAAAGSLYRYRLDGNLYPDPASRHQPQGVSGPSEVVDPAAHDWRDTDWRGRPWAETVLYELHVGAFSPSNDFDGVAAHLDHLAELGVTAIELMPIAETPGRWNWGYDGVLPYAVQSRYGGPEGLKRLVEAAHARGLSVILDVVYNHFGPEGNFLHAYAGKFFTDKHKTPWGPAVNFDDDGAQNVREFFVHNALYWLEEYHLDGLRFDAVHAIKDDTAKHFVVELGERIRAAVTGRPVHLILENERNQPDRIGGESGGPGPHSAQWNDDFHHVIRVLTADAQGGYYDDYREATAGKLGRALTQGFVYQGETSPNLGRKRGAPSTQLAPPAFVTFIQNHDQVGNHAYGWRLPKFASTEAICAATAVLLLSPQIPMLWMGEEWNCDQPFPFFCDFHGDLAEAVRKGRAAEFAAFPEFRDDEDARAKIPDPLAETTFRSAVLDWDAPKREPHRRMLDHYRTLLALRHARLSPLLGRIGGNAGGYEVLGRHAVRAEWKLPDGRLVMEVNLGPEPVAAETVAGETLYGSHEAGAGLPPWSVTLKRVRSR